MEAIENKIPPGIKNIEKFLRFRKFLETGNYSLLKPPTNVVGRNDFCPCGSGRKYKKCCGR